MTFRYFDPHSFGRGFTVTNLLNSYSSPGPGAYNPQPINKKNKNIDWMFRKKTFIKKKFENNDNGKDNKKNANYGKPNIEPVDFYNVQEKYINESKKPKIPQYSFGKAKRIEYKEKNNRYKNSKNTSVGKKISNIHNFEEEKNNLGDNAPNIKFEEEKIKKGDNLHNLKNKNKDKNKKKSEEELKENDIPGVGKYNIRGSLEVPVVKFGTEKKGLNYDNIVSPGPAKYNLREKEFGKTNTKYSFPKGPRGIKSRPFTPGPGKYDPSLNLTKIKTKKYSFPKEMRMKYFQNTNPGPNKYNTQTKFGEDGKKISMARSQRINPKDNGVPGPNKYCPNYKILKTKNPKYRIGTAKRRNLFDTDPSFPGPNKYNINEKYNSKKPKSPTWKFGTCKSSQLFSDNDTPGVGMYSLRNNRNNAPKYTFRGKFDIKSKEVRPGVGRYNVFKSSQYIMKKEPKWKIGKASRDDYLTNDRRGNPGPGMYRIPCSIVDVNGYTREKGKFDKNFIYI